MQALNENYVPNTLNLIQDFSSKQRKSSRTQSNANKLRLKFLNPEVLSNWRQLSKSSLLSYIHNETNVGTMFKLLFSISQDLQWRQWTSHIETLIQNIHNSIIQNPNLQVYTTIPEFQRKLQTLCCLKSKHISAHISLLIEELIVLNKFKGLLDQSLLGLALLDMSGDPEINTKILWILTMIQKIHPHCIFRLLKNNIFKGNELPFLSILANYITYCSENDIFAILQHPTITQLISDIIQNSTQNRLSREAQLVMNNIMSRKGKCFLKVVENSQLIEALLNKKGEETWWTLHILHEVGLETGVKYIDTSTCMRIASCIDESYFNQAIWETFTS